MDSNHDELIQSQLCYRYTIPQKIGKPLLSRRKHHIRLGTVRQRQSRKGTSGQKNGHKMATSMWPFHFPAMTASVLTIISPVLARRIRGLPHQTAQDGM